VQQVEVFKMTTSDSSLHYPEWKTPYQGALLEADPKKLAERVAEAEVAIFKRLQQLNRSQDGHVEREAIEDAIRALRVIKRYRLNFPDWESAMSGS
jgi:hypothetical protein